MQAWRVILVGARPGVGVSLLTANLAVAMRELGAQVSVLEPTGRGGAVDALGGVGGPFTASVLQRGEWRRLRFPTLDAGFWLLHLVDLGDRLPPRLLARGAQRTAVLVVRGSGRRMSEATDRLTRELWSLGYRILGQVENSCFAPRGGVLPVLGCIPSEAARMPGTGLFPPGSEAGRAVRELALLLRRRLFFWETALERREMKEP